MATLIITRPERSNYFRSKASFHARQEVQYRKWEPDSLRTAVDIEKTGSTGAAFASSPRSSVRSSITTIDSSRSPSGWGWDMHYTHLVFRTASLNCLG